MDDDAPTQFAAVLQDMANGDVRAPIKDATGIEGYWDFSVNFSGVNLLPGSRFDPNVSSEGGETESENYVFHE